MKSLFRRWRLREGSRNVTGRVRNRCRDPVWLSLVRGVLRRGGPEKAEIRWSYSFLYLNLLWFYWCS